MLVFPKEVKLGGDEKVNNTQDERLALIISGGYQRFGFHPIG